MYIATILNLIYIYIFSATDFLGPLFGHNSEVSLNHITDFSYEITNQPYLNPFVLNHRIMRLTKGFGTIAYLRENKSRVFGIS